MSRLMVPIILLFAVSAAQGAPDAVQTEPDAAQKKPEFTDEQMARFKAAEEEYKDNPAIMKIITRLKENYGISDEPPAPEAKPPAPPEPAFKGSRSEAENAYRNKDYETAMTHYKALAQEGDGEASLILGTMYEQGLGTDPDPATAQAWFRKAAQDGNRQGQEIMDLYRLKPMPPDEQKQADQRFEEINKKQEDGKGENGASGADNTRSGRTMNLQYPQAGAASSPYVPGGKSRTLIAIDKTSSAILAVEKLEPPQHLKTTTISAAAWQPEKLQRTDTSRLQKFTPAGDDD